jgi:P pilus assembly chaperone PapD
LQKILRIGVPVVIPPAAEQPPVLAWRIYRTREGKLEVSLTNHGNAHVKVANLSLVNVDGGELGKKQIAAYVLSGQRGNWLIKHIPAPAQGAQLQVIAQTDIGEINGGVINLELK